ncbi:acetylxylan esterase [Pseudonocardia sp. RS11V-5]|uniref:acetylxylan esterase n=1 Tax=Pseudonocardia terrae TaxID=2905831 RepID=UPI001E2FD542|nr:acetylxylan esterase [Pseudonocardia terrae]MCE3555142.1 acetylxylan esterase [Pseudonocardia terrae]
MDADVGALVQTGALTRPPDLEAFWATTLAQLREVPLDLRRAPRPAPTAGTVAHELRFRSWGGQPIHGYAITWEGATPRPLVVHAHGYRSQAVPRLEWVRAGCHVVGFDVRGFGRSLAAVPAPAAGWLLTGARRPETSVLRGAVCDYVRATDVATALQVPTLRAVSHGVSLAGGLALMAQAVAPRADLLVLGVPTFGWAEGRRLLVEAGSGAEVAAFLEQHPQYPEDDLQTVLAYFDAALLAPRVGCPTVVGLGVVDRVVPRATVEAVVAQFRAPVEVMTFPVSHDAGPGMRAWARFDERWLELAVGGVPSGFGRAGSGPGRSPGQRSAAASRTQPR